MFGGLVKMPKLRTGLEFELFVVDRDLKPYSGAFSVAEDLGDWRAQHEFGPYQLEIATSPADSIEDHKEETVEMLQKLKKGLPQGTSFVPIGSYPLQYTPDVTPDTRLKSITRDTNETFGFQSGMGVELQTGLQAMQANISPEGATDEDLIKINSYLRGLIPVGVGVSTNSPYLMGKRLYEAEDLPTLLKNMNGGGVLGGRRTLWQLCEGKNPLIDNPYRSGIPPKFSSFDDYQAFLDKFSKTVDVEASSVESLVSTDTRLRTQTKDGRPLPRDQRRVEYRPCDMLSTLDDNLAVATFLKTYVAASFEGLKCLWPTDEANLSAMCSLAQNYGTDFSYSGVHVGNHLRKLIPTLKDYALPEEQKYLDSFARLLDQNPAKQQLREGPEKYVGRVIEQFASENKLN